MKTLIELYDETPIENVLAADTFRPERVIYLCPSEIAQDRAMHRKLREYFAFRHLSVEAIFLDTSLFYADKVERQIRRVLEEYPDCAIDIAGGSDAALFAAGIVCSGTDIPVFTHSRRKQCFFNINNAPFADHLPVSVRYSVEDFFLMAYGSIKEGRVSNRSLENYLDRIDAFFAVFLKNRRRWNHFITWMQKASPSDKSGNISLAVSCDYEMKGERGSRIPADENLLRAFEKLGFLSDLKIEKGKEVSFRFADEQIRFWLRDQGSVLEIYTWKACRDTELFQDVRCSTIVEWDSAETGDKVTNEIDVMAVKDTIPAFISCKTCAVDTVAINELAILRDRYGGNAAKAFIISTENCRAITLRRAHALNIDVITLNDLRSGSLKEQIRTLI
jgi:hypothetical protein